MPIYARVVACQPRKTQHQLEVAQAGHLEGKILCMGTMNTESGWEIMSYRASRGGATVNEF